MTVSGGGTSGTKVNNLTWLHCNACHRSFEHHNRLADNDNVGLRVMRSDLTYSFTSCGHIYCEHCVDQHTVGGKLICTLCNQEATAFKIVDQVPKALEMYLRTPISQLEDSISVMTFQISNANLLIKSLRTKVAQQKELISKAKQELASQKVLKEKVQELQQENDRLCRRLDDVSRAAGDGSIATHNNGKSSTSSTNHHQFNRETPLSKGPTTSASPTPNIHVSGRLSLRSPIRAFPALSPFPGATGENFSRPSAVASPGWSDFNRSSQPHQRGPSFDYYHPSQSHSQSHFNYPPAPPPQHLSQPMYSGGTPDSHHGGIRRPQGPPHQSYSNIPPSTGDAASRSYPSIMSRPYHQTMNGPTHEFLCPPQSPRPVNRRSVPPPPSSPL